MCARDLQRSAVFLLVLLCGAPAFAANRYLERARALYADLEFSAARQQLEIARQVPTNDPREQREVLDLLARCQVAEGKRAAAEKTFAELLALDPHFEPPRDVSPKILDAFGAAKARIFAPGFVQLVELPAPTGLARAELVDPWHRVDQLVRRYRPAGAPEWQEQRLTPEQGLVVIDFGQVGQQWYLEARAADGSVVAQLGSEQAPRRFETLTRDALPSAAAPGVEKTEPPRWGRAGAWGAAGVAVLAGVAGGYLQATSIQSAQAARDEPWSDLARQHHARARAQAGWATGLFIGAGVSAAAATVFFSWELP
ncbi:MAG TPA: hypothetical protein VK447_18275 [Myxococcaceae bacterium]|nr:hypothetical protein [Myxococcaceae bacterium]